MAVSLDAIKPAEGGFAARPTPEPATPPESRLAMPVQSLQRWSPRDERPLQAPERHRAPWPARAFVFGGAAALTVYGAYEMYEVVSVGAVTLLQWLLLALFTVNFSWIALAFTSAILGFVVLLR